jgi:hypothetical protein
MTYTASGSFASPQDRERESEQEMPSLNKILWRQA